MTVEREFRLGKSAVFGTLNLEYNDAYDVNITGGAKDIVLPKEQGWVMQPLPFVFPTKRNAIVGVGNNRFILVSKGGRFWYRPGSGNDKTENELRQTYAGGWFVVFEGEDD